MIMIIILLQGRNHYEMENALYLKISFEVCPILEWIKKNSAEDNLLKKKFIALLIDWKEKYLPCWSVGKKRSYH